MMYIISSWDIIDDPHGTWPPRRRRWVKLDAFDYDVERRRRHRRHRRRRIIAAN